MNINPEVVPFITFWRTTSNDEDITISINADYGSDYDYTVDWGDGNITKNINDSITHTYSSSGNHIVKISGKFPAIKTSSEKLQTITQWGDIAWSSFYKAFASCSNLDVNATDTPALSDVHSMSGMFSSASNLKGNKYFNDWDVSSVTDMSSMFSDAEAFNQPLNNWNVSKVINMDLMFDNAKAFNQALNNWNVSSVNNMDLMFSRAKVFNQPLNNWDVSSVTSMSYMFWKASAFTDQDLSSWSVDNVVSNKHTKFMTDSGGENTEPNW
jgi:surface protein